MLDYDLFDPIVDVTHPFFSSLDCLKVASAQSFSAPSEVAVSPRRAALKAGVT